MLSDSQFETFYRQGYVQVPGVVPRSVIERALRAINTSLGDGIDPAQLTTFRAQSYCPELRKAPAIVDLILGTPAFALAEAAIGPGQIKRPISGQIALRFPVAGEPTKKLGPHLDGMHSPHNGVPKGEIANFTMLVGVLLSDLPAPNSGNLTVWPGTHWQFEEYFRAHSPQSLLDGLPPIAMPEPYQITGHAGDVVLVHYQVAHGVAPNVSPHVRYAVFFRLHHVAHESQRWEAMTDIWLEWAGVREFRKKTGVD